MRPQGAEAFDMHYGRAGAAEKIAPAEPRTPLEVVPGGGRDARARRGVSRAFVSRVKIAMGLLAVFIAVGLVRVFLTSATVGLLSNNTSMRSDLSDAQNLNADLRIEQAVLSSNSRISRIATQNYGMVLSSDALSVEVGSVAAATAASEAAAEADAAAQAQADAAAAADAARAEELSERPVATTTAAIANGGDAAQAAADGGVQADLG